MRVGLGVAVAAAVTACAGNGSKPSCDVRIQGRCAALKAGSPADQPPWPSRAAENAIDLDPSAQTLSARCRFRGIALNRVDVYRCQVRYFAERMQMELIHDRTKPTYEFRIVRRGEARRAVPGVHGVCNPRIAVGCRYFP